MLRACFPAAVFLILALPCPAGAGEGAHRQLEQVVVSATRSERNVIDAPVRVEVVTAQDIERTHARSLTEALANISGLQLREIHGKSGHEVVLQGLSGDQVLILIDGMPVSASTGSRVDVSQIALTEVERIEIVRGATSAQYGSAAMGGVINVITRPVESGLGITLSGDLGSYADQNPEGSTDWPRRHGQIQAEGGNARWQGRLVLDRNDTDGFDPTPGDWARPGDAVQRQQVDGRLQWRREQGARAFLGYSLFDEDIDSRYVLFLPGGGSEQRKEEQARRQRWSAGGEYEVGQGGQVSGSLVHERFDNDTVKFAGATRFDDRQADLSLDQISVQYALPPALSQQWLVGVEGRRDALTQFKDGEPEINASGEVSRHSRELFAQTTLFPSARLEWLLGARYQHDSDFGDHTVAKLAARWHAFDGDRWRTTLRAGVGQGYRVPNLKERYFLFDHSALGYVVLGNPDLLPEESDSAQLGMILYQHNGMTLDLGVFANRLRNLIQVDRDNATVGPGGVSEFRYANVGRARTRGVEVAINAPLASVLDVQAGYTFLEAENLDDGTALTRRPAHQARLGVDWQLLQTTALLLRARYQSDELVDSASGARSPAWAALDLRLNHAASSRLTLFAGIDNVTGEQRDFSDHNDFRPLASRFFYLGARYQLKEMKP